ncbi:MAG: hypothetical protein AAGP08_06700 [Pseudomonadota bacterium]
MRHVLFCAALLAASPLSAKDSEMREGLDLLSEGTQLLLRGLMTEIEPALRDLEDVLGELDGFIGDLGAYHAPEVLPNGDILIRRKDPKPTAPPPSGRGPEIEL